MNNVECMPISKAIEEKKIKIKDIIIGGIPIVKDENSKNQKESARKDSEKVQK